MTPHIEKGGLLESIYHGAVEDFSWDDALDRIRENLAAERVVLQAAVSYPHSKSYFFARGNYTRPSEIAEWEEWSKTNRIDFQLAPGKVRIVDDITRLSPCKEFREMVQRYRVGSDITASVVRNESEQYELHALRSKSARPFTNDDSGLLKAIVPHLARAISLRRSLISATAAVKIQGITLSQVGIGCLLIDPNGSIHVLNELAQWIVDQRDGLALRDGQLHAADSHDDAILKAALGKMATSLSRPSQDAGTMTALRINRAVGKGDLSVLIRSQSVCNHLSNNLERSISILVRHPEVRVTESSYVFRSLFGFTPMESSIAVQMINGLSRNEIQNHFSIKLPTMRSHIRSMFLETGVNCQSDLMRILLTMGAF